MPPSKSSESVTTTPTEDAAPGKYQHGHIGLSRIFHSLCHSRDGLLVAIRVEAAFRQLLLLHAALISFAFILHLSPAERALMLAVCFISLLVELMNSAIEATVDRISLEWHPLSKNAKDMGSAAQVLALLMVAVVWFVILWA